MRKTETSNPNDGPSFQAPRYRPNWTVALVCLLAGVFISVALVAYDPLQSSHIGTGPRPKNPMGWIGAESVYALMVSIGASTWLLPVFFGWTVYMALKAARHLSGTRVIAMIIALTACSGLWTMVDFFKVSNYFPEGPGGVIGKTIYGKLLADAAGGFGSAMLLGTIYAVAMLFIFTRDIGTEVDKMFANFSAWREERAKHKAALAAERVKAREEQAKQKAAGGAAVVGNRDPVRITPQNIKDASNDPVGPSGGKKTFAAKSGDDPLAKPAIRIGTPLPESIDAVVPKPAIVPAPPPRALCVSSGCLAVSTVSVRFRASILLLRA
jgi:S-DNA-T family DNA segregation ATPase FtsK/SpoIIIE